MGMVLVLRRADPATVELLREDPNSAADFVCPEDEDYDPTDVVDFDKGWHGLHFLLAGTEWGGDSPLAMILNDHEQLGDDQGYGPAWVVTHADVRRFDEALSKLSDDDLAARFDPAAFVGSEIYLADMFASDDPAMSIQYLMQSVPELRALTAKCVATNSVLVGMIA